MNLQTLLNFDSSQNICLTLFLYTLKELLGLVFKKPMKIQIPCLVSSSEYLTVNNTNLKFINVSFANIIFWNFRSYCDYQHGKDSVRRFGR